MGRTLTTEANLGKRHSRMPDAQQIKGQAAIWRIRSGSYRIAYTVHRNVPRILLLRIDSLAEEF